MIDPVNVFIPAAGVGERLLPITSCIPKPLLPIAGRPMLEIILEKISLLPAINIGVNLHYKREVIENWLSSSAYHEKIVLFPEDPALGTGGALKNAERFLSERMFLVHNADILSDIDIERLMAAHRTSGDIATLAVHDFPKFNRVAVDSDGHVTGVGKSFAGRSSAGRRMAFTGIAVYNPEFLKFLPGGVSHVVDSWLTAIRSGCRIGAFDVSGCEWNDIGTPTSYASAVFKRLKSEGETVFIHQSSKGCDHFEMDGYVVIEKDNALPDKISLRNCIVLPSSLPDKTDIAGPFENGIIGPDFVIPLKESEIFKSFGDYHCLLIGTGGSDRTYYRIRKDIGSHILVKYADSDPDFDRHLEYTEFFRKYHVPVPALLKTDINRREAFFEDLGDLSLYSWLKCRRPEEQIEALYERVLDISVAIHSDATMHVSECPLLQKRIFDYEHLRWETNYFIENFVARLSPPSVITPLLNEEFHKLALKVDSFPKTAMHRDFQSQNIMITRGAVPRLIDYQGARIGPPAYDIASLLWDPYYRLYEKLRERLLNYYIGRMKERAGSDFNENILMEALLPCRLQRHMQALGAYGFLSSVKGKKYFLKHVDEGMRLLKEDIEIAKDDYPSLYELARELREKASG